MTDSHVDGGRAGELLAALVRCPSENPPGDERAVAELVAARCEGLGLETSLHEAVPGRPSVVAEWRGGDGPTLCYCSHIDVVPAGDHALWDVDPYAAEVRDGRMLGRGTSDAKGPVAAALEAVAALKASGFRPEGTLQLALVADEETMGFQGAGHLVETGVVRPDVAIVGEPTSVRVVRAQRGACWLRITTRGKAAHGSAPERGVNAIGHMAAIVARLGETLPDLRHELLGGPSLSVGAISGGVKVNIVPALCTIEVDRRTVPGETRESVTAHVQALFDELRTGHDALAADVEVSFFAAPFEVPEDAELVRAMRAAIAEVTGAEAAVIGFRGASDARFIADLGVDVIVCGPGDIALAHTAHESIDLGELETGARAYARAFAGLLS